MKRILFYISILVVLANIFTPFNVRVTQYGYINIQKNIVSADDYQIKLQALKDAINKERVALVAVFDNYKKYGFYDAVLKKEAEDSASNTSKAYNDAKSAALTTDQQKELETLITTTMSEFRSIAHSADPKNYPDPVGVTAQKDNNSIDTGIYTLLAPIPGLTEVPTSNGIGDYLGTIFKIVIGLCGALAVIMIVIGGIKYMGDESVFGKTEAKNDIKSAILGLLIALGAYALLNTINPDLTGVSGVNIDQVTAEIDETPITKDDPNIIDPIIKKNNKIARCPEGIVKVSTDGGTFYACSSIANNLRIMINQAWDDNVKISGGGFRTLAAQEAVRATNCGGRANIYNKNAKCNPATAYPGTSMHESGLAFDFTCGNSGKQVLINVGVGPKNKFPIKKPETEACFNWLKQYAVGYRLKNLLTSKTAENWHWSTTGT